MTLQTIFFVSKALNGLKRTRGMVKDLRCPITFSLLQNILASLSEICSSPYQAKVFSCAFVLAYFALLRVGECTVTGYYTNAHFIRLQGIQVIPHTNQVSVTIAHSKTQQTGAHTTLIIQGQPFHALCPVRSIINFLNLRPSTPVTHF